MNIQPLGNNIGALITGISLKDKLDKQTKDRIRKALLEYEVIFFPNQTKLTHHEYSQVVNELWPTMSHPFVSESDPVVSGISPYQPYFEYPEISGIYHDKENKGNLNEWHSDLNWLRKPSRGSVLRAMQIPKLGGDTVFVSMNKVYEGLSKELKEACENLKAYHDFMRIYKDIFVGKPEQEQLMRKLYPPQLHPVILKHPLTGKKTIFVNRVSTSYIDQISEDKSTEILWALYAQVKIPEYQLRYHWQENDIAAWDNLATQHYAVSDYWPYERKMERILLGGIALNDD